MERNAFINNVLKGIVHSALRDGAAAFEDPRLIHFMFRESNFRQHTRSKIAIDHPHGRIAKHQGQNTFRMDLVEHALGCGSSLI